MACLIHECQVKFKRIVSVTVGYSDQCFHFRDAYWDDISYPIMHNFPNPHSTCIVTKHPKIRLQIVAYQTGNGC